MEKLGEHKVGQSMRGINCLLHTQALSQYAFLSGLVDYHQTHGLRRPDSSAHSPKSGLEIEKQPSGRAEQLKWNTAKELMHVSACAHAFVVESIAKQIKLLFNLQIEHHIRECLLIQLTTN